MAKTINAYTEEGVETVNKPLDLSTMTREQFDAEMQKALDDIEAGRTVPAEQVREEMRRMFRS